MYGSVHCGSSVPAATAGDALATPGSQSRDFGRGWRSRRCSRSSFTGSYTAAAALREPPLRGARHAPAPIPGLTSRLLRTSSAASGGTRIPHVRVSTLRLLRSGGHRWRRPRYARKPIPRLRSGVALETVLAILIYRFVHCGRCAPVADPQRVLVTPQPPSRDFGRGWRSPRRCSRSSCAPGDRWKTSDWARGVAQGLRPLGWEGAHLRTPFPTGPKGHSRPPAAHPRDVALGLRRRRQDPAWRWFRSPGSHPRGSEPKDERMVFRLRRRLTVGGFRFG